AAVKTAQDELKALEARKGGDLFGAMTALKRQRRAELDGLRRTQERLKRRQAFLSHAESHAAVDSELMLLWWDPYELRRWQTNLNYFQVSTKAREGKPPVLLTARLDGPSPAVVKRMIDDAVAAEKTCLKGK